ncbi:MAG TPA: adenosylmethionine--8-amino-7-oxononanoate transaminase [Rickettsiales bacterium]|nr:adenosylmethionine--8-amino-7-oxononanoate transaminase [Rickettsiales bacterium]
MDWYKDNLKHIWLPYTQMKDAQPPLAVAEAEGSIIKLADGRELVDGIASWWTACHGYRHPHIEQAIKTQLETLPHMMFGGMVHEQALTLAGRLANIAPPGLSRVFFSDSGSVAIEVALKMALQYWQNKRQSSRNRFLCFRYGYHGDTTGAMSVSDPDSMHKAFRSYATKQYVVDVPNEEYGFAEFDSLLGDMHKNIAGIIIEPLVQGAGGMKFHSSDVLAEIYRIAKKYEVLFIADEIATGFGRTGSMFACNEAGISPDLLCIGKALTGGTMTLAATLATEAVFDAFLSDDADHAFMHGPTYMANPLACAAANASLDLFESEPRLAQVEAIEAQLREELRPCRTMDSVVDVRVKGAIGVVQLEASKMDRQRLRARFIEEGVWVRPIEDIIYIMPAFTIPSDALAKLTGAVVKIVQELG